MQKEEQYGLKQYIQQNTFDTFFFACVFVLLTVGIIMMFSASYVWANVKEGSPTAYFTKQSIFAGVGIVLMLLISKVDLRLLRKMTIVVVIVSFLLLSTVYIFPYKLPGREAIHRWANLPLIGTFQPSELAKFALITFCARIIGDRYDCRRKLEGTRDLSLLYCFLMTMVYCVVVFLENHVSGAALLFLIGCVMMVLGGLDKRIIIAGLSLAVIGIVILCLFHDKIVDDFPIPDYAKRRIVSLFNKDYTDTGDRWQTNQSLFAIGSGGLFGQGFGKSKQKHLYMPEPQNDFVFSIVCEELGFVGAVVILLLFALLIWRGFVIGIKAQNRFSSLLVLGIMSHVGLQVILNVLVITDIMPNTGISLPFFSYGGTSLLVLLCEMGFVLSASRQSVIRKK